MSYIPYGRQSIEQADIDAVVEVLKSSWWTQGPKILEFENILSKYCNVNHVVATSNATSALHIACRILGVRKGDKIWTSPITFVASANCALYCDAEVDFVDIDPVTLNISTKQLEEKLVAAKKKNKLPKVVIPVHFTGRSCDMKTIKKLSSEYGFSIIEDASHCIGGSYQGNKIGGGQYSDIAVFSFHPVKIIGTGEGGALTTNSFELAEKARLLRTHGITKDLQHMVDRPADAGAWYYQQVALGYNYRITDIQCALGISQMQRIDSFVAKRRKLVKQYNQLLSDSFFICPSVAGLLESAWHLYVVQVDPEKTNVSRLQMFNLLRAAGIGVNVHYIPVYQQPCYKLLGFSKNYCPNAEKYYANALTLPLYFDLADEQQRYIVNTLLSIT